jgi:hypothetical protein
MKIGARSQFAKSQGASVQHFWDYWKSEYFCIKKLTDHAHGFLNRPHDIGSRVPRGLGPTLALELARAHAPRRLWQRKLVAMALKRTMEQGSPHHRLKTVAEARTLPGNEERQRQPHVYAGVGLGLWRGENYERNEIVEGWGCSLALFIGQRGSGADRR